MRRNTRRVRYVIEESSSDDEEDQDEEFEWCNSIKTTSAKSVKCKMEVEGADVRFLIYTGASINSHKINEIQSVHNAYKNYSHHNSLYPSCTTGGL